MKKNGYDPATIREAEARLQLFERGFQIADQVRNAFSGVTLGSGVGLQESQGLDDYEDGETLARYRSIDEKDHWDRIPPSELNRAHSGLSFFDAEGMRFHLPAYLIADLKGEYHFGLDFNLTQLEEHGRSQFSLLNEEQRLAVTAFLLHILDDPDYEFNRTKIQSALLNYWLETGAPPQAHSTSFTTSLMPGPSTPEVQLLRAAYAAFNARDIDAALVLMTTDVAWPKAFKGGFVRGPEEVRAYWTEQWSEIDPHVEPIAFYPENNTGRIVVKVHQIVRDLSGTVLADDHVGHHFTIADGLIKAMEVGPLPSA